MGDATLNQKLNYWKLSTWPLHVRLRIVQAIVMAYIQFFLPLIMWRKVDIDRFMSSALSIFWKTKHAKKGLNLLSLKKLCSPKQHGGLNILNKHFHALAHKYSLLLEFVSQRQPWAIMLAAMCVKMSSKSFGDWTITHWDAVFGHFEGKIAGCPFSTKLILAWKKLTQFLSWTPRVNTDCNSLPLESIHWSEVFEEPLAMQEPRKAYFLAKKGVYFIKDVLDNSGHVLSFIDACPKFGLSHHYRPLWEKIESLLAPFEPLPSLDESDRLQDWSLHRPTRARGPLSLS